MIDTYTIEQLYERLKRAERIGDSMLIMLAQRDYQRALIVEARHKQGEY